MKLVKVTNTLVQMCDPPNMQKRMKVTILKLLSDFLNIHPRYGLMQDILIKIDDNIDAHMQKLQFGFMKNKGIVDIVFLVHQIMEKVIEHQVQLHLN